ncbi:MAG: hypothetical protein PHE17_11200 [Thiothrix sp.]|uniref:hypothetical protein n=1 Tax=Thiothrix sp. TaxID=1032 RepID=UPI00261BFD4C|nr:hypothetical protein [Thiothrix sp.]MDD5393574.1 hypothetical protein [Thiothrix sp.]
MKPKFKHTFIVAAVLLAMPAFAAPPAGTPYYTDRVDKYINEVSAGAFDSANEIMCLVGQTKAEEFINKGSYVALVDNNLCGKTDKANPSNAASSSGEGQSAASLAPDYQKFTMDVTQADANSPVQAKMWILSAGDRTGDPYQQIQLLMTVTETPNATSPLGKFRMDWIGYPATTGNVVIDYNDVIFKGFMTSDTDTQNRARLRFFDQDTRGDSETKATLIRTSASAGYGSTYSAEDGYQGSFNIAFTENEFLRNSGSENMCFSRNDYVNNVWSYGLYNPSNGARVNRNSGFQVKTDLNNRDSGWASYWGVWLPNGQNLTNGQALYKVNNDGTDAGTAYTVLKTGGKLIKNQKETLTLNAIKNVPLNIGIDENGSRQDYQAEWNGSAFIKTQKMECTGSGNNQQCYWLPVQNPNLTFAADSDDINAYSNALGGNVRIPLRDGNGNQAALRADTAVTLYKRTTVMPGDAVPVTLQCYDQCIQANGSTVNHSDTPTNYTFGTDMLLKVGGTPITSTSQEGLHTGALVPVGTNLACDWSTAQNPQTCTWKAWNLEAFYTWETGSNSWNQLTALRKADGTFESFSQPLQVKYAHANNDDTTSQFRLEYAGFGNLQGIPGKCVSMSTHESVTCGPNTRWIPEFSIADGTEVTDSDGTTYLVKGLGMEQHMRKNDAGCTGMTTTSFDLPVIGDLQSPTPTLGAIPTVTAAPKVVGGVIQYR